MALSSLTLFDSYNYMNSGIASTLLFVYPIMVAVIMTFFFKESFKSSLVICFLFMGAGLMLLMHLGGHTYHRIDTHGDIRGTGTCHGCGFECRFPRAADNGTGDRRRPADSHRHNDSGNGQLRGQGHSPCQENVPEEIIGRGIRSASCRPDGQGVP